MSADSARHTNLAPCDMHPLRGRRRGAAPGPTVRPGDRGPLPPAPTDGAAGELDGVCVALARGDWGWEVGWYGSAYTVTVFADRENPDHLWKYHLGGIRVLRALHLSPEDPHAHLRCAWGDLPAGIRRKVRAALGTFTAWPNTNSTNSRPLDPF